MFSLSLFPGCRVGVVGSRSFRSPALVREFVASLPPSCVVCSGWAGSGCRCGGSGCSRCGGVVDAAAGLAARACGLRGSFFPPEWCRFGRAAGPFRSELLVSSGLSVLVVFASSPSCLSPGSARAVSFARRAGVPVVIVGPDGNFSPAA